jgi:hypothetical protein
MITEIKGNVDLMVNNRLFLLILIGILLLISCVQAAPATYVAAVQDGLVVYYNGTLSDNFLVDLSGNSNIGYATSVTQGTDPTTGASYIKLNGVNSKIDVSNNAQTNIFSPVSIEFYGSINNFTKNGALVSKYKNWASDWYLACSSGSPYDHARFAAATSGGWKNYESDAGLVAGQVCHIVVTYDNNTARIYVNGEDSGSSTWNFPIIGGTENITIGSGSGLPSCNCSMYTFRLYNRSLTQAEVEQNYRNLTYIPPDDIIMIKRLVYGDSGLPRYMGSYAIQQSDYGLNILNNDLSINSSIGTPFFQNNNSALTNYSLIGSTINGIRWKNCYAPGSSAVLTYTGENRSVQDTCFLSNDSFNLNHSVTYLAQTQVTKDGVPVNGGRAYEFYGDGLNTVNRKNVTLYTDNAEEQTNLLIVPNTSGDSTTGKEIRLNYQTRNASVTRSSLLDLPLSSPQLTPMPVPSGYLGALIFAEHADYTDHDSLQTVIYGTNNTSNPTYGKKGFIGHNLTATWSVFAVSSYGGEGLDSPELKSVVDDMYTHGFEITPHSLGASGEDYPNRAMAETYLPWYVTNYSCRNWIDHGLGNGKRNIGLRSCGWDPTSPHYIMDLFQQYNVPYAWAYIDVPIDEEISTSKINSVGLPADIVWQNTNLALNNSTSLYQWKSCFSGKGSALTYYTSDTIDDMLSTYGVSIWHDHWPDNSSLPGEEPYNYYYDKTSHTINETFDGLLSNISAQKQAGKLWNPTVSKYIDYWIAASNVEVRCTGANTYTVVNHNPGTVKGFSMRVEGAYSPKLDGVALDTKTNGVDTIFWMDLSTGTHTITLEA